MDDGFDAKVGLVAITWAREVWPTQYVGVPLDFCIKAMDDITGIIGLAE
jgi:hypothetical protein